MIKLSKEGMAYECERLTEWINEGRFVTIFDAQVKHGFDNDTHYPKVCLIATDKGVLDMTNFVANLLHIKWSYAYGKAGTLLWHGSIFDLQRNILCALKQEGCKVNVDTSVGKDAEINKTFRWL